MNGPAAAAGLSSFETAALRPPQDDGLTLGQDFRGSAAKSLGTACLIFVRAGRLPGTEIIISLKQFGGGAVMNAVIPNIGFAGTGRHRDLPGSGARP